MNEALAMHHNNGGETNLDNIRRKRPDATVQPACAHVTVRSQHISKKDIVKEERFEGVKWCSGGGVRDNLYRRPNFRNTYRVDEVTNVESTLDDGFWIPKNVFPTENKAGIGYADPFQD